MGDLKKKTSRNGKIEFYRFIFSMYVLFFHIGKYIIKPEYEDGALFSFFAKGGMGVEFFFIVTGFLMAKSVYKIRQADPSNANIFKSSEGLGFLRRKYFSILPQHIVAFAITFVAYVLLKDLTLVGAIKKGIDSLPAFFLMQMNGMVFTSPNHVTWYLSVMFVGIAIVYPFLKKYYETFTRYVAPIASLIVFGWLIHETKKLTGVETWVGIGYKGMLRGIFEIALGTSAFELSRFLSEKDFSFKQKLLLTLAEYACFGITSLYIVSQLNYKYEIYIVVLLFVMVSVCFSGKTIDGKLFNNRVMAFLGKFTLPIYLSQLTAIYLVNTFFVENAVQERVLVTFGLTLGISIVVMVFGNALGRFTKNVLVPFIKK